MATWLCPVACVHNTTCTLQAVHTGMSVFLLPPQDLTIHNADEYVELVEDFYLATGIQRQMEAFKGQLLLKLEGQVLHIA